MSLRGEWRLPASAGARLLARRAAALALIAAGIVIATAGALALGFWLQSMRSPIAFAGLAIFAAIWLARSLWSKPPKEMPAAQLSVPERGRLVIAGDVVDVRSCRYDGAEQLLWLRGALGVPLACVRAAPELACEIVDALERPERGLRTIGATPPMVAIPFVGWFLAIALGFAMVFGLAMLIGGPPRIGVPAAAITLALGVLLLRPARVQLGREHLTWSWWTLSRAIPLGSIERVVATAESLRIETADGRTRKLHVRMAGNGAIGTGALERGASDRLAAYAAFVERSARAARAPSAR